MNVLGPIYIYDPYFTNINRNQIHVFKISEILKSITFFGYIPDLDQKQ